ncbi:hypothetical protein Dimus_013412 [Dionaea muscipula]
MNMIWSRDGQCNLVAVKWLPKDLLEDGADQILADVLKDPRGRLLCLSSSRSVSSPWFSQMLSLLVKLKKSLCIAEYLLKLLELEHSHPELLEQPHLELQQVPHHSKHHKTSPQSLNFHLSLPLSQSVLPPEVLYLPQLVPNQILIKFLLPHSPLHSLHS